MNLIDHELNPILKALNFAALKHKDQRRKDEAKSPYINHPIALASILCNEAGITDAEVICGALLHDTIEDTNTTPAEIEDVFGSAVTKIVLEVTDDKELPKDMRKLKQVEHAAHICDKAKLVKLADKISNLRDILSSPPTAWSLERKREYFDWTKRVIDELRGVNVKLESIYDSVYAERP